MRFNGRKINRPSFVARCCMLYRALTRNVENFESSCYKSLISLNPSTEPSKCTHTAERTCLHQVVRFISEYDFLAISFLSFPILLFAGKIIKNAKLVGTEIQSIEIIVYLNDKQQS